MILHGLSLGLDARPGDLDPIFKSNAPEFADPFGGLSAPSGEPRERDGSRELYSFSITASLEQEHTHVFGAMVAYGFDEVRRRIRSRYGRLLEDEAVVRLGFDWSEPLACAMVSEAMADLLILVAQDPNSSLGDGLDFQVDQRFLG